MKEKFFEKLEGGYTQSGNFALRRGNYCSKTPKILKIVNLCKSVV